MSEEPLYVLTIGDHHFQTSNVKECTEFCEKVYKLINDETIDVIINMGDTLHNHEKMHVVPYTNATKFIKNLAKMKPTYLIIGNHDRPNNNDFLSDYHPFVGLHEKDNLTVVDKVIVKEIKGMKFAFVPYVHPGRLFEAISTNKEINIETIKEDFKAFFGHHEIHGTNMGVITSTTGDKWPKDYPYFISGHIHDYCRPQTNVIYVGTPMQHNFGERDDKTVSLWTIYPDKPPIERRIDLGLTKRLTVTLKCEEVFKWMPPTGYLIRLIIEGTNSEIKSIMKTECIKNLKKTEIKIVYNTIDEINMGINKKINFQNIKLSYGRRFLSAIMENPGQVFWFNKIFVNSV